MPIPTDVFLVIQGTSGRELFLHAYQYILWKQCFALIHIIGLPHELETVVKDLWRLRLQLLSDKIDAEPHTDTLFSSQSNPNEGHDEGGEGAKRISPQAMPTLIETLSLCFLATVLLRLPISMGDMHRWAIKEEIPYVRAIRFVPSIVKHKLPAEYIHVLDTTSVLAPDDIRRAIHASCLFYQSQFGLTLPPINAHLLLLKYLRCLGLPGMYFSLTKQGIADFPATLCGPVDRLRALLSMDFKFPRSGERQYICSLPEVALLCLLVIVVKLLLPFEDSEPDAHNSRHPIILRLDWRQWVEAHAKHEERTTDDDHLPRGWEMSLTETDAMHMSDQHLDDYLDWFQRTWIDEERLEYKNRGLSQELFQMFPLTRSAASSSLADDFTEQAAREDRSLATFAADVTASMGCQPSGGGTMGNHYPQHRTSAGMNPTALAFHEAVAEAAGIQIETLLRAVHQMERRLQKYHKNTHEP